MSLLSKYNEKTRVMRQLQEELAALEEKKELQQLLAFKEAIENVLKEHDKTEKELLEIFGLKSEGESGSGGRRKRTPSIYKNPETGETIEVRGGRQKDYQDWIAKYGKEKVQSWKQ